MQKLIFLTVLLGSALFSTQPVRAVELDLSPYKGKVVYVDLWASWCVPCRASFPWMETMHQDLAEQGLVILAVNTGDEPADAERFLKKMNPSFQIITDPEGDIAAELGAIGMPFSVLFDRDGQKVSAHKGFRKSQAGDVRAEIEAELEEAH